jgi:hypothetical protein
LIHVSICKPVGSHQVSVRTASPSVSRLVSKSYQNCQNLPTVPRDSSHLDLATSPSNEKNHLPFPNMLSIDDCTAACMAWALAVIFSSSFWLDFLNLSGNSDRSNWSLCGVCGMPPYVLLHENSAINHACRQVYFQYLSLRSSVARAGQPPITSCTCPEQDDN